VVPSPAGLQQRIVDELAMYFIKREVPMSHVEDPNLRKVFALIGMQLPCKKNLTSTILDRVHDKVKQQVGKQLAELVTSTGFQIASDGWKKKAALQGAPLMNVMLLKPSGGSLFIRTVDTSWERKNAEFLSNFIANEADQVCVCIAK